MSILKIAVKKTQNLVLVLFILIYEAIGGQIHARPFTIVALPDTQFYSESKELLDCFKSQIRWIIGNQKKENIVFVTHLGDVTDNRNNPQQWANAMSALMPLIDNPGDLPFAINRGNHDGIELFLKNVGPHIYEGKKWYVGSSPNGLNHAHEFYTENLGFLHIALEKDPGLNILEWAKSIIAKEAYQKTPVIVSTHDYLAQGERTATGRFIWENLIKYSRNIFMVLSGHIHTEYSLLSHNSYGRPVYQMVSDYQAREHGGQALMRLIKIDLTTNTIDIKTFSPGYTVIEKGREVKVEAFFEQDRNSQFGFNVDLKALFLLDRQVQDRTLPEQFVLYFFHRYRVNRQVFPGS